MQYTQHDLGYQLGGAVVEVTLAGTEANVQLLDSSALQSYKRGGRYQSIAGHYRQSPVLLTVPSAGYWYVVVDLGGFAGSSGSVVRVIPPATAY